LTAYDSSGGTNNGTLINGPVWSPGYTFAVEPFISAVNPQPGSTVTNLPFITVSFSEPVTNVDASDLLINGVPAIGLTVSGTNFIFSFARPSYGYVHISWASNHNIVDLDDPPLPFNSSAQGATFDYYFLNPSTPLIVSRDPEPGSFVAKLTNAVVTFNKPVKNVDASDLLINGVPANQVRGSNAVYEFLFTQPQYGVVNFVWVTNNGISDLSTPPNVFDINSPVANWSVTLVEQSAPYIWSQNPQANSVVTDLTQIQVVFSESVKGVDASDLLINGVPATQVSGSGSIYTFTFAQPPFGNVVISWATNHGITDIVQPPIAFDSADANASWTYTLMDLTPPTVASATPTPGTTLNELTSINIIFSETVTGVNASDLLINGSPAIGLVGSGNNYTFYFPQPTYGAVQISWAANHGITDLAVPPNSFNAAGATWQYNLDAPRTVLVATNASWKWKKGTSEASDPIYAWRYLNFDDSSWTESLAPFYYDTDGTYTGNTLISDMLNNYTMIYMRNRLVVSNLSFIKSITVNSFTDDGYILWINGNELVRYSVNGTGDITYNNTRPGVNVAEPLVMQSFTFTNVESFLVNGTNLIAVQGLNANLPSTDFLINIGITAVISDPSIEPPKVANVTPQVGEVYYLTNITITFTEPVQNIDTSDLLINGAPASSVTGSGNSYTFTFPQPSYGNVIINWEANHGIVDFDTPPRSFDGSSPTATFQYVLLNPNAPVITSKNPSAGATVSNLAQITVTFSKPVANVDASDLLINGSSASGVSGDGQIFTFIFSQPAYGTVNIGWSKNHGIVDATNPNNKFDETRPDANWQYNLIDLTPPVIVSHKQGLIRLFSGSPLLDMQRH